MGYNNIHMIQLLLAVIHSTTTEAEQCRKDIDNWLEDCVVTTYQVGTYETCIRVQAKNARYLTLTEINYIARMLTKYDKM